jgi:enamine deaminase RidA (YjgF/YER057c/UK114 family)
MFRAFCSDQAPPKGRLVHPDDIRAQFTRAIDHVEAVLREAGAGLPDVVRFTHYTTDVDRFFEIHDPVTGRLAEAARRPTSTPLGVVRLASPNSSGRDRSYGGVVEGSGHFSLRTNVQEYRVPVNTTPAHGSLLQTAPFVAARLPLAYVV